MKPIKQCNIWTLDAEMFGFVRVQFFTYKYKKDCIVESKKYIGQTTIQKRKLLTDKY